MLGYNTKPITILLGVVFAVILIIYATKGGFKAVVKTDIVQITLISIAVGILIYATSQYYSTNSSIIAENIRDNGIFKNSGFFSDWIWIISMLIIFFPFQISVMDMWQRVSAVKGNVGMVQKMIKIDSIGFLIVYSVPIIIGILVSLVIPNIQNVNNVFFVPLIGTLSPIFVGLLYAGLIAAIFSTADTLLVCSSHSFFRDFWGPKIKIDENNEKKQEIFLFTTRIVGYFIGFLSILILVLLNFFELNEIVIAVFSGQIVFFIPLITAIYKPDYAIKKATSAIVSIVLGLSIPFIAVLYGKISSDRTIIDAAPIIGFIISLIVFFIIPKKK